LLHGRPRPLSLKTCPSRSSPQLLSPHATPPGRPPRKHSSTRSTHRTYKCMHSTKESAPRGSARDDRPELGAPALNSSAARRGQTAAVRCDDRARPAATLPRPHPRMRPGRRSRPHLSPHADGAVVRPGEHLAARHRQHAHRVVVPLALPAPGARAPESPPAAAGARRAPSATCSAPPAGARAPGGPSSAGGARAGARTARSAACPATRSGRTCRTSRRRGSCRRPPARAPPRCGPPARAPPPAAPCPTPCAAAPRLCERPSIRLHPGSRPNSCVLSSLWARQGGRAAARRGAARARPGRAA